MKWRAFKKGGKYYASGFREAPADAEVTEEYDEPRDDILEQIDNYYPKGKTVKDLEKELKAKGVL